VYHLQQLGYVNATGIYVSEEQIAKGRSIGINNLHCGDLQQYLANCNKNHDVVIAKDVIEHFTKNEVFEILTAVS